MFSNLSLWEAIKIGGPVMYVLIICSIVSIAIILEKIFYFHARSRVAREDFMKLVRQELRGGSMEKALMMCQSAATPFSAVAAAGLRSANLDEKTIADELERKIIIEASVLEERTAIIGTIGSTAVYIGLLGTVWGIIETFRDISQVGSGGINVVIHGISAALICTAAGLFVAIPAVSAYNYFVKRISRFVMDMELCASEISNLIREQKRS